MKVTNLEDLEKVMKLMAKYNVVTISMQGVEISRDYFEPQPDDPDGGLPLPSPLCVIST